MRHLHLQAAMGMSVRPVVSLCCTCTDAIKGIWLQGLLYLGLEENKLSGSLPSLEAPSLS